MKLSSVTALSCAVVILTTSVVEAWAAGRGGSRSGGGSTASRGSSRPSSGGHHHHSHTRVFVGGAFFYGPTYYPYYPAPYYAPAPVYVEPEAPVIYIEQGQDPELQAWYYCQSARAYYPYVGECPEGWQRVVPDISPQTPSG